MTADTLHPHHARERLEEWLNALTHGVGAVVSREAAEALKVAGGFGTPMVGRLMLLDARDMQLSEIRLARDPHCPVCAALRPA